MSLQTNYQNVNFATQYAVDKIVGVYNGSFNAATQTTVIGGYLYQYPISHLFTRPVFCELLWSTDGVTYADGGGGDLGGQLAISYSDSNNIYVTTSLNVGTIYYKVIASWIDNYDTTNPLITPVLDTTNNFYFDSRNNYQKIYHQDTHTITGSTFAYIHGLGYAPNYKVFFESIAGQVWPTIAGGTSDFFLYDFINQFECETTVSSTTLSLDISPGVGPCRVWYRVYLNS